MRIIRFLNEQMEHIEVLGVAIQPRGTESGQQTLSVEVEGALEVSKNPGPAERREESEFWTMLRERRPRTEAAAVEAMIAAMLDMNDSYISMGSNPVDPSLFVNYRIDQVSDVWPLRFSPKHGRIYLQLRTLKNRPGFESDEARSNCRDRMRSASGHPMDIGSIAGQPYFTADVLCDPGRREAVAHEIKWIVARIAEARH